tara:strand:+ start:211 stop:801 length:591 start_codon:yes stop_codon:yes gene_type:complete
MTLLITELIFGDVHTISIPTDAIFIVSLLIVFALLGYFFNNILSNHTNQFTQTIVNDSNLELVKEKLEDQLELESTKLDEKNLEQPSLGKLNFLIPSKRLRFGSLAVVAMGGASLLGLQHIQKAYEGVSTSQSNIQLENQLTQSQLSVVHLKPLDKTQTKIKEISYINPSFSTIKRSTEKNAYKVKGQQIENNFSF